MNGLPKIALAALVSTLVSVPAFADDAARYTGHFYDPTNPDSSSGFTHGYKLYRTIGCPGRGLLDTPCKVPAPPAPTPVADVTPPPAQVAAAPAPEPEPAPPPVAAVTPPVRVLSHDTPMVLKDVNFRFNHYNLMPKAHAILDHAAADLKDENYPKVQVDGYTDSIGTVKYNLKLSRERAESVKHYLVAQGVPATTLTTKGWGKTHFVASNKTLAGRRENRRVELHVE